MHQVLIEANGRLPDPLAWSQDGKPGSRKDWGNSAHHARCLRKGTPGEL